MTGDARRFASTEELIGFMSRFLMLGLAVAIGLAGFESSNATAASPARVCAKQCTKAVKHCLSAAKAQRTGLRAGCAESSSSDRKQCRAAARATAKATARACRTIRGECKGCCRATAQICGTLRIVGDAPRGVSQTVTEAGGTIRAAAADGTVYTLAVPAGALTAPVAITLTPVTAVGHLPLSGGLAAAVALEPEGLLLFEPATLTIELRAGTATDGLVGFGAEDGGEGLHLRLIEREASRLTMSVTHFSMVGAGIAITSDVQRLFEAPASSAEVDALNHLAALEARGEQDESVYFQVLAAWYGEVGFANPGVLPGIQLAFDDANLRRAIRQFLVWLEAIHDVGRLLGVDLLPDFAASIADAKQAAARKIDLIARSNLGSCAIPASLAKDEAALFWQGVAEALGVIGLVPGTELDLATVLGALCARLEVEAALSAVLAGDATLTVQPRLVQPALMPQVRVTVGGSGLSAPVAPGQVASGGTFTTIVHTAGGDVVLDIEACIDEPAFPHLRRVCARTQVARGLAVEPEQVTLAPGGQQGFRALRQGQDVAATWSTSGGTIGVTSGLFTAPSQPGTYFVTAHATDTGETATGTVLVITTTSTTLPSGSTVTLISLSAFGTALTGVMSSTDPVSVASCQKAVTEPANTAQVIGEITCTSDSPLSGGSHVGAETRLTLQADPGTLVAQGPFAGFTLAGGGSLSVQLDDDENGIAQFVDASSTVNVTAEFFAEAGQEYSIGLDYLEPWQFGRLDVLFEQRSGGVVTLGRFRAQGADVSEDTLPRNGLFPIRGLYSVFVQMQGAVQSPSFTSDLTDGGDMAFSLRFGPPRGG